MSSCVTGVLDMQQLECNVQKKIKDCTGHVQLRDAVKRVSQAGRGGASTQCRMHHHPEELAVVMSLHHSFFGDGDCHCHNSHLWNVRNRNPPPVLPFNVTSMIACCINAGSHFTALVLPLQWHNTSTVLADRRKAALGCRRLTSEVQGIHRGRYTNTLGPASALPKTFTTTTEAVTQKSLGQR
eukprot:1161893-Pelagomonas_calceolata.AAC.2